VSPGPGGGRGVVDESERNTEGVQSATSFTARERISRSLPDRELRGVFEFATEVYLTRTLRVVWVDVAAVARSRRCPDPSMEIVDFG
jgi:hypothetical protein